MKGSLRERHPGNWELIVQLPRDPETGPRKPLEASWPPALVALSVPLRLPRRWP